MKRLLPAALILGLFLLSGCGLLYKLEIRQGNPPSTEALAALKPGMTKRQVRLLLGTPPVSDPFHPDRWDYLYTVGRAGEPVSPPPRLTLYFRNDALESANGELAPAQMPRPSGSTASPAP